MFVIHDTLNGNNLDENLYYNLLTGEVVKFKNANIT